MSSWGAMTATTAGQTLLPANKRRVGVMIKAPIWNTDTVFFNFLDGEIPTSANGMPLEPTGTIFLGSSFPEIMAPEWQGAITMAANSGQQDIRFVEF